MGKKLNRDYAYEYAIRDKAKLAKQPSRRSQRPRRDDQNRRARRVIDRWEQAINGGR